MQEKSRVAAGVLAILLGGLGIHKFYLGPKYVRAGIIQLVVGLLCMGCISGIIGLIEGIIYLTMSEEAFQKTYVEGTKEWF